MIENHFETEHCLFTLNNSECILQNHIIIIIIIIIRCCLNIPVEESHLINKLCSKFFF
jgi:hypothetical protein